MQPPCTWVVSPVWPPWPPSKPIFTNNLIRSPRFHLVTCRCLARTNKHTMKLAGNKAEPRTVWKRRKLEILRMKNEKNKTNTTPQHQFSDGHQSLNDPDMQSVAGFLGVPTAGWRSAPAYSQRGRSRGCTRRWGWIYAETRTQEHTI